MVDQTLNAWRFYAEPRVEAVESGSNCFDLEFLSSRSFVRIEFWVQGLWRK